MTTIAQNTGEVISLPRMPWYSSEKPSIGATVAYAGINPIHISIEPGIAMTAYLVHILNSCQQMKRIWWVADIGTHLVTSAAFPRTVARTAVYSAVPHNQWPAGFPSA